MRAKRLWKRGAGVAVMAWIAITAPVLGQPRFLPESEYDRVNVRRPQAMQLQLEALRQSNAFERLLAFREDSRYRKVGRPVGRLKVRVRESSGRMGVELCTAFLISEEYALTSNHCVAGGLGISAVEAKMELNYVDESDARGMRTFPVEVHPVEANADLDYAILRVGGNPGREFGAVNLSNRPLRDRDSLFVIHHAEGAPQTLSRKDCRVGQPGDRQFLHTCETLGGSSGAPVYSDETVDVVGVHFAAAPEGNYAMSMEALRAHSRILGQLATASSAQPALAAAAIIPIPPIPALSPEAPAAAASRWWPWSGLGLGGVLLIDAALQYQYALDLHGRAKDTASTNPDKSKALQEERDDAATRAMVEAMAGLVLGGIGLANLPDQSGASANASGWQIALAGIPLAHQVLPGLSVHYRW